MKKTIYLIGIAASIMGGITSCTLDAEDYVTKSSENFPATTEDATQALAGIYQNLNQVSATPECSFLYAAMLASDDCLGGGGPNDLHMQSLDMLMNSKQDMTQQFWKDRYQGINRANSLLDGIGNIELAESDKNQIEGEAKFLRAFYYYELASMYGRVPLTITSQSVEPSQPTAAELWGQILQDLRDAAEIMPNTRKTDGHVDKYTAEAMLGRAWLFYTGMYCNGEDLAALTSTTYSPLTSVALPDGSTLTKDQVIGYIDDCVNNSGYSLVTSDFRNLWAYTNRFTVEDYDYTTGQGLKWVEDDNAVNPETLFAIKYNKLADWSTSIGYANNFALHFGVRGMAGVAESFPFGQGWGAGPAAPNLVNDWRSSEPNVRNRWLGSEFRELTAKQYPRPCAYPFRRCITNAIRVEREHGWNQPGSRESRLKPYFVLLAPSPAKRAPLGTRIREHSMERYPSLAYSRRRIGKADQRENIHQWPRGL